MDLIEEIPKFGADSRKIARKLKSKDQIEWSRNPGLLCKWRYNSGIQIESNPRAQLEINYY